MFITEESSTITCSSLFGERRQEDSNLVVLNLLSRTTPKDESSFDVLSYVDSLLAADDDSMMNDIILQRNLELQKQDIAMRRKIGARHGI